MAVDFVGIQSLHHLNRIFHLNNQDFSSSSSSSFNQAISAVNRSGHARFRRGPPPPTSDTDTHAPSEEKKETIPPPKESISSCNDGLLKKSTDLTTSSFQSMTSSLASSAAEGSVSNGRSCLPSLGIVAPAPSFSSRKPPLPSSHRKRHIADVPFTGRANHSVSRTGCHCCKRRKTGSKREIRRVPVNGSKVESIPADDYSWKKYGEKKVDGSPFPRVYYKCSSAEGCPARKRVELALTDSKMLVVTYDREHRH